MKNLVYFAGLLLLVCTISCKQELLEENPINGNLVGKWQQHAAWANTLLGGNNDWELISPENASIIEFTTEGEYFETNPLGSPCKGTFTTTGDNLILFETDCQTKPFTRNFILSTNVLELSFMTREGTARILFTRVF